MALKRKPPFKIRIFNKAQEKHPTREECMALERKPPFKIQLFKKAQDKHPTRVETRKKESEAQTLAKTEYRRRRHGRIIITDGNGDTCWDSGYASSMPVDIPKW